MCLLDRGLVCTRQWGDMRETSLLPSRPHTSLCVPQVLQAPQDGACPLFVHGDAEQLVVFPHGPIARVTVFRDA
jgi:hypothetical protein